MRISDNSVLSNLSNNISSSSASMQALTAELSSGKQINEPSDNPSGTAQAMTLQATLGNVKQYLSNIISASSFLSASDSSLSSVSSLLTQARQIAVAAANGGTQDASSLSAYQTQISAIITQVSDLANSDYNGTKLFSGQQTSTNAYDPADPTNTYKGDSGALTATIGAGQSMQINVPGSQVFGPIFTALQSLNADLTSGNTANIATNDISGMDTAATAVNTSRAVIGTKLDQLTNTTNQLQTAQVSYQNQLSNLVDIDLPTVYADYQQAQNIYQASLVATSKAMQFSLADYIH